MQKTAKILYGFNSITCIFIGTLHNIVHFQDLVNSDIQTRLSHEIPVSGTTASIWDLWQGMSLMMGFLLIFIGLFNLLIISRLNKNEYPPIAASILFISLLSCVIYMGYHYFSSGQIYGGIGGIIVQSACLFLTLRGRT